MTCISTNLHHAIRIERFFDESEWRSECLKLTREERAEVVPYLAAVLRRREVAKEAKARQKAMEGFRDA